MNCTRCQGAIIKGQKYYRTPRGAHHEECPSSMKTMSGIERIAAERRRQIATEGWTAEHDDCHYDGEIAMAAAMYTTPEPLFIKRSKPKGGAEFFDPWPWDAASDKRKKHSRIRCLEIAGALIAAEIDRLERADAIDDIREADHAE